MLLAGRGFLARFSARLFRMVTTKLADVFRWASCSASASTPRPRSAFSAVAASQASERHVVLAVMIFPALFTAGMTLVDTTDSVLDGRRLRLGLPQSDPQALVQSHHHLGFRGGGASDRRHRGAWA